MIVELLHQSEGQIGRFQAPAAPRTGESIRYDGVRYTIDEVRWQVEKAHNQNIESVRLVVTETEMETF